MSADHIYITANPTPNPDALKFIVDRQLVDGDPVSYSHPDQAQGSPMAEKLFGLGGIKMIFAFQNFVTVTRAEENEQPWQEFARTIGQAIRAHLQSGTTPNFIQPEQSVEEDGDEKIALIKSVLDEIRPMVAQDGGNIVFAGYHDGVVQVFMQGSCSGCPSSTMTLQSGIERRLREVLPEIRGVVAV